MTEIKCPECGRVLGVTEQSLEAKIICKKCKKAVDVHIKLVKSADYL